MKNLIIISALAVSSLTIFSCSNNSNSNAAASVKDSTASTAAEATSAGSSAKAGIDAQITTGVKGLVGSYLQVKNALAKDNVSDAAAAGQALASGFEKFDQSKMTSAQKKSFQDIADDAKEMATHIGMSTSKLPHQREHFDMLSKDMYDLVRLTGADQLLYVDHCPMYNNKKGAIWLSETKDIKNPYMGASMPTCGTITEELK